MSKGTMDKLPHLLSYRFFDYKYWKSFRFILYLIKYLFYGSNLIYLKYQTHNLSLYHIFDKWYDFYDISSVVYNTCYTVVVDVVVTLEGGYSWLIIISLIRPKETPRNIVEWFTANCRSVYRFLHFKVAGRL